MKVFCVEAPYVRLNRDGRKTHTVKVVVPDAPKSCKVPESYKQELLGYIARVERGLIRPERMMPALRTGPTLFQPKGG